MDLCVGEQPLPGLKLPNTYNKLWSMGQEKTTPPICVPLPCERSSGQTDTHAPSCESSKLGLNPMDPSTAGNITIPRPHGRKTPELGSVLALPAVQSRSKGTAEEVTTASGQEFRQALGMTTEGERSTKTPKDSIDLINLDPLNSSAPTNSDAMNDGMNIGVLSSTCQPTLTLRSYPQGLPPLPRHPHTALNPFAQSLQHNICTSSQMHYLPTDSRNPFSSVYGPRPGSYLHTPTQPQSFSTVQGLYRQHSLGSFTQSPCFGRLHSAFPCKDTSLLHSSPSNNTLSGLADSMSAPSTAIQTLAKPFGSEGDSQATQDPFGDLLTMAKQATPPKEKIENIQRKWETFE